MTSVRGGVKLLPPLRAAVARARSEAIRRELEGCQLLAGLWCHGLTAQQIAALRNSLPPTASLIVAKNSELALAVAGTRWAPLASCAKGMNAWLFVHSDDIPPALRPCRSFQKDWKVELNDFTGAIYEGRLYAPDEFPALESMPTRSQSYAYFLGCLQMPAASLLGILRASQQAEAIAASPDAEEKPAADIGDSS